GASRPLLQRRRLQRDRLELGELGPHRVMPGSVVARRARCELALEQRRPAPCHGQLGTRPLSLLHLRPQLARPRAGTTALLQHPVARGLGLHQLGGPLGQLLQPLPEVLAVARDHLELRVEQREHRGILGPERALAGRTRPLGPELDDLIALLLHLFVQLEQLGALGFGVLAVLHPRRPLGLRGALRRLQPLGELPRRRVRSLQLARDVPQLGKAALQRPRGAPYLRQLRLVGLPGRRRSLQPLELGHLLLQPRDGGELGIEATQLLPGGQRVGELAVEPLELLPRADHALLRHASLAVERERALAARYPRVPAPRPGPRSRAPATGMPPAPSCRAPPAPPAPSGR